MDKTIAKILSIALHPLLIPTLGLLIIINSGSNLELLPFQAKKIILIIVFVSTVILPLTFVPFYIFQKIIKNVQMDNSKERLIPFLVTFVLYAFCNYLLWHLGVPDTIVYFILIGVISAFILFVISFFWKISAHMLGMGGLVGALISISFILKVNLEYYIFASILFSGILGYSRLILGKHKPPQIYVGWILGSIISVVILFVI